MKIIVVGANGAVGQTIVNAFGNRHEIIAVGRTSGDIQIDIEDQESVRSMYKQVGKVDAVVIADGGLDSEAVDKVKSAASRAAALADKAKAKAKDEDEEAKDKDCRKKDCGFFGVERREDLHLWADLAQPLECSDYDNRKGCNYSDNDSNNGSH